MASAAEAAENALNEEAAPDEATRFGERLVATQRIDAAALARAQRYAARAGSPLVAALSQLGLISERDLAEALAAELDLPLIDAGRIPNPAPELPGVSPKFLREKRLLPIAEIESGWLVAMADPLDVYARSAFALATERNVSIGVAEPRLIERAIDALYGDALSDPNAGLTPVDLDGAEDVDVERLRDQASEAPVIQLVNRLIARAVELRASDIHLEPFETQFRVRYRVDGVLQNGDALADALRAAVVSRIKIMARLDIAERRLPQDGRIKTVVRGKSIDLRVATLPILNGEAIVIRVLDRDSLSLDLETLCPREPARSRLREIVSAPDGIFLVTGPTGSGKTTTLYAALRSISTDERKTLTVEDPIEYQIDGVNQVQVRPGIGLTFASVLRSMLRHDPDIIMVGEIRDGETARIAAQAALTGHLVMSTLHTNDAASAITRLIDMGVEDYLITSTVFGVAAQRLVRRLCPVCRTPYRAAPELVETFSLAREGDAAPTLYRARGCEACGGRGYRGRIALMEVLRMSDGLRSMILRQAEAKDVQRAAIEEGMRTMFEDGLDCALRGETTLEEAIRVAKDV